MSDNITEVAFVALKEVMQSYFPLSEQTWMDIVSICHLTRISKHAVLYPFGEVPMSFAFVYSGLLRAFVIDSKGNEYNKVFFAENTFPGSMTALLTSTPSRHVIQSLETSDLIIIDFKAYRKLLLLKDDLKLFHIEYLEKNWLLEKEVREVALVQETATERYQRFLNEHTDVAPRLTQYHIASHLGITPTQLSRIRKSLS